LALEAMQTEHEADRATSLMIREAAERACTGIGDVLARLVVVVGGLRLDPERMRRNLELSGGLILAEALMLRLGEAIGRQEAHDLIYEAAQAAFTQRRPFAELLTADPRVTAHLAPDAIAALLDPAAYTGLCAAMAGEAAARARGAAGAIRGAAA